MVVSGRFVSDAPGPRNEPKKDNTPGTINPMEVNHESQLG
jgi:hypothetical protein